VVARAGSGTTRLREEEPAGSVERRVGELGNRWRRKSGEGAAGGRGKHRRWAVGGTVENKEGKQEEEDEDLFVNFAKVQGVHYKVKFSSQIIDLMKICPKSKV
jgi:hypothetical protein